MMIRAIVLGVVVGRAFYVLNPPPSVSDFFDRAWYGQHLLDLQVGPLAFWNGGLGNGGIALGGMLGVGWTIWRQKLDPVRWADWLIIGLLGGLAIAPLGSFFSGLMFGPQTGLPWGMSLASPAPPYDDLVLYPPSTRFHPTPLYFVLLALVLLGIVLWWRQRSQQVNSGDLFLAGWRAYCVGAAVLGNWQVDVSRGWLHLSGLQGMMLVMAAMTVGIKIWRRKQGSRNRDVRVGTIE
jgi:phosphatidylglycerol:prolipoprotein diacylglycerol transferase